MLGIIQNTIMFTGATVAVGAVVLLWILVLVAIDKESNELFKEYAQRRSDKKLFKKIERFRNDFA